MKLFAALLILTSSTDVAQAFVPTKLSHTTASKHIMPGNVLNVATVPSTEDVAIDKKSNNDVMENFGAMPDLTGIAFSVSTQI